MTRLVLVTRDERFHQAITDLLGGDTEVAAHWPDDLDDPSAVVKHVALSGPDVVILGPDLPQPRAFDLARAFDEEQPEVEVLLVATSHPPLLEEALRAGIRDILPPGQDGERVRATIERALEVSQRRRANLAGPPPSTSGSKVIVVLSPKGGAGKTTMASNLAVGLASVSPRQVVLFDTDLQFGDVANALRLVPTVTFHDAVRAGLTDATSLKLALTPHPTGVFALCAPELPADSDDITGDHVSRAIGLLRQDFKFVVVDTDAGLGERTLSAIEQATDLVFICATDVPSVRALRKELEALDAIGMTEPDRHFVLNRADAKVGLSGADIQATINHRVDVLIPSNRSVPVSMNRGIPLLEEGAVSTITRALHQLVARFVEPSGGDATPTKRGGRGRRKEG